MNLLFQHLIKIFCITVMLLFSLVNSSSFVHAAPGYVSDRLIIYLKDRLEEPNKNIARVKTGDRIEILETQGNYHLVKTEGDDKGWILKQYILFTEPKGVLIQTLQSENEKLHNQLVEVKKQQDKKFIELRRSLQASNDQTILIEKVEEVEKLTAERDELFKKNKMLQLSLKSRIMDNTQLEKNAIIIKQLKKDRKKLDKELTHLRGGLNAAKEGSLGEKMALDPRIQWLLAGAFILLVGIVIGKIGKKRNKSKFSF